MLSCMPHFSFNLFALAACALAAFASAAFALAAFAFSHPICHSQPLP
jgi:hypothetical protein